MMAVPPSTTEIGCSLGTWSGAGKCSNRYNFGCVTASDSLFDSTGGFSVSTYPVKKMPRLELLQADDCQVGHWPTF